MAALDENQIFDRLETSTSPIADDLGLFESVKRHLRDLGMDQDTLIDDALRGAIDDVEERTNRTWRLSVSSTAHFRCWSRMYWLPRPPHVSVTSLKYYDRDNTLQTVSADDYRTLTSTRNGIKIEIDWQYTFPNLYDRIDPIQVAYVRGFASHNNVPQTIKVAVRLLSESNYDGDPMKAIEAYQRLQPYVYRGRP